MPNRVFKTETELEDFVRGCTLMGVGGGGFPKDGLHYLKREFNEGRTIGWVDVSEIGDGEWTAAAYGMGSTAYRTPEVKKEMERFGMRAPRYKRRTAEAVRFLEEYTGKRIEVIVPIEIGAANTPDPIGTAAYLGKKVVDGDYAGGRAIPELTQVIPHLEEIPMVPLASVDEWGDRVLIDQVLNYAVGEKIGKLVASVAYSLVGNAAYLIPGKQMKEIIVPGTLTKCYEIGKAIREARDAGRNPIQAVLEVTSGWVLFEGKCTEKDAESRVGYYWGTHTFQGSGDFSDQRFKIWFKNENHITWLNDAPYVTSPDIITVVEARTCEPTVNPDVAVDQEYIVIGMKAHNTYRSGKGLEVLCPNHFDFDMEYIPIESRIEGR